MFGVARVPLAAFPLQPEQQANARRVEDLGLGRRLPLEGLTPELIRETVIEVSEDPAIRGNLEAMTARVRGSGGAPAAAAAIEDFLRGPAVRLPASPSPV
ncbi:hypothetical protein OOZ51_21715 [Arthrobacter sp. MI7-26]|uniref:hypothetical protein n=1 Tax=Arthrobacter sp. MI7-26 TaxID=2993653 RepID=UPI00224948B6|nr:hypothetical protein [Arthrobacter sp. MI7-26]MCX2750402.1 hypothetical protein [Arthrobacter sp. MI7-26]